MHVSLETQVVYQGVDKKFHPEEISSMPLGRDVCKTKEIAGVWRGYVVGLIGCRAKLAEGIAVGSKDSDKDEADGGGHREKLHLVASTKSTDRLW